MITTTGDELEFNQKRWLDLLGRWYMANSHEVAAEKEPYAIGLKQST